jgi:hypothetical protein
MTTYYKLSEDKTHIEQSTPFKEVAEDLGLDLETEEEIVYGYDGKQYIKGTEPKIPQSVVDEKEIAELQEYLTETDWYAVRYAETGVEIPEEVKQKRQDARKKISELRNEV